VRRLGIESTAITGSGSAATWTLARAAGGAVDDSYLDMATGSVIGIFDSHDSAAVREWLAARPRWWRLRAQVVAIDPSAAFRAAVKPALRN
jgi:hypothetical protein